MDMKKCILENDSWFNEISYFNSEESIQEHVAEYISKHPEQDDPFYVANLSHVVDKHKIWKRELPEVELYYATKACTDKMVLKLLASLGVSFDCASMDEIESIINLGVSPQKIMFSNPFKFVSHLKYAASVGVENIVFDSEDELKKIHQHFPSAKLVIRIKPTVEIHNYLNMSDKFGCNVLECNQLLKKAQELSMAVEGISFHVGHCTESPLPYENAILVARQVYDSAHTFGHNIEFIDIGGGYQGPNSKRELFVQVAAGIKKSLKQHFPNGIRVMGEPGQFMCVSAFSVYAKVIGTRSRSTNKDSFLSVYISGGHFNCIPKHNFHYYSPEIEQVKIKGDEPNRPLVKTKFWGPTCDPLDAIIEMSFPTLQTGDWLRFTNMGAYTLETMTRFNGFRTPKTKYVASTKIREILEEEENIKHLIGLNNYYIDLPL